MRNDDTNTIPCADNFVPFIVSFDNYLKSLSLPAIDFECGGKTLTFILDSGSDGCHINRTVVDELRLETSPIIPREGKVNVISTGNGIMEASNEKCKIKLSLEDFDFNVEFSVENLDPVFNFIRENDGVQVHGILGVDFLRANNWTIDFANNMAYPAFKVKVSQD